jgi:hypothetical protein
VFTGNKWVNITTDPSHLDNNNVLVGNVGNINNFTAATTNRP